MLLTMKAYNEAMRALCYANAHAIDLAHASDDPVVREQQQKLADLLTPLSKAWCTDLGVEMTSLAVQVHGGMGYVEETGVAQHFRDARIAPIYEGTNGIQALDLVGRKLPYDGGAFVKGFLADQREVVAGAAGRPLGHRRAADRRPRRARAHDRLDLRAPRRPNDVFAGATPYLRIFGTVVGGVYLAKGAAAAQRLLDAGDTGDFDADYLEARITVARFYAQQLLPQVHGLVGAVTSGCRRPVRPDAGAAGACSGGPRALAASRTASRSSATGWHADALPWRSGPRSNGTAPRSSP
jgi:3-(methylthio)propanoyl-CoA dehydrogenase